jgi:RNA polymerase sigma-B factor
LIDHYCGLAHLLASRASRRQGDAEDLDQVALIGLLEALRRFDPERGVAFTTFAWATVQGELKRHRRNHAWTMRVPRRLQEAYLRVAAVTDELTQRLGRTPGIAEIAEATGDPVDLVIEALDVRSVYRSPVQGARPSDEDRAGDADPGFTAVDDRATLAALIPRLPEREQRILTLRFVDQLTQSEIADAVGLSQMHVSRLLAHSLAALRQWWREGAPPA